MTAELGEYLNDHAVTVDLDARVAPDHWTVWLRAGHDNSSQIGAFDDEGVADEYADQVRGVVREIIEEYHAHLVDLGRLKE